MKIVQHCVYYPPEVGGLESHVAALSEGLARRGHEVTVVTSASGPEHPRRELRNGVEVIRTWFPSRTPPGWILHALGSLPATRRAARGADVLHAQAFASVVPLHLARQGLAGGGKGRHLPLVATFHTSHFLVRAQRPRWKPVLRRLVQWPDHALAASSEIAGVAEDLAPGVRVEAVTNGVETERFRPVEPSLPAPHGVRQIIIPRRLFPKNGVEDAVRAVPHVLQEIPDLRVLLVGDGPERPRLEGLARTLGVEHALTFLGARPHTEMPGLLSSAEIAVFPSLMEATSVAALECMACERPVVATRVGGLPEIVDEGVGTLVPPGDPEGLAEGLLRVLRRPDLAEAGREARRRVVTHWSNDRLVERHLVIYEALAAGRPVPPPSPPSPPSPSAPTLTPESSRR